MALFSPVIHVKICSAICGKVTLEHKPVFLPALSPLRDESREKFPDGYGEMTCLFDEYFKNDIFTCDRRKKKKT